MGLFFVLVPGPPELSLTGEGFAGRLLEREEVSMCSVEIKLGIATLIGACLCLAKASMEITCRPGVVATVEFKGRRLDI